jgi:CTD small phosphatase-like protein 2
MISYRYFRDSCYKTEEGFYVKDLRVIDRDLGKVLLIDNVIFLFMKAAYSYCFQLDNGVPIVPFYDNKADLELMSLISYLKGFIGEKDVRIKNEA